jgi:hypothetical protein
VIAFPEWYEGGFPDRELVVMDLLQPFLDLLNPRPLAVSWLPKDYGKQLPLVRVYRGGGGVDEEGRADNAAIQVAVIGRSRAESWALLEYCRQVLLSYEHGGAVTREDGTTTSVDPVSEMVGPQQIPELNPDYRLVQLTFRVPARRPVSTPDYARIREAL